jgi:hypothetical protein
MMERVRRIYNEVCYAIFDGPFRQCVNKNFLTIHGAIGYAKSKRLACFSIWKSNGVNPRDGRTNFFDCVYSSEDRK